jgi:hypothetical protein
MQSRIDRLEGLVLSLMSGNSNNVSAGRQRTGGSSSGGAVYSESQDGELDEYDESMGYDHDEQDEREDGRRDGPSSVEDEVEEVRNALGIMKVQGGKTFYRGETHWAALLSEVCAILSAATANLLKLNRLPKLGDILRKQNRNGRMRLLR